MLKRRIFLRTATLLLALIGSIAAVLMLFTVSEHRTETKRLHHTVASALAGEIERLILWDDRVAIRQAVDREMEAHHLFEYAFVVRNGQVYMDTFNGDVSAGLLHPTTTNLEKSFIWEFLDTDGTVYYDMLVPVGKTGAVLRIGMKRHNIDKQMYPAVLIIALVGFIAFLVGLILSYSIALHATREITLLSGAIQSYSYKGDETRLKTVGNGADVTELAQSFRAIVSERKQAEEALRESEEKYRSIMESMKDSAYIVSQDFRIEYMNPKMVSRIGYDTTGEPCHKTIYNSDEKCSWCVFDKVQQGEHNEFELENPVDNRYYSVLDSPIYHSDGTISKLSIFRDITENKAIEAQLRQARKMESIGTLTGGIAHDFNNILYMITGNAELALEDIPESNPVHTKLEEIKAAALRAAGIVKQLFNFSRKTDQKLKPLGAITIIKDALKFLRSTIPYTIEIRKNLPNTDVTILADPIQINQALINICTNAFQAMEDSGGILEINVENEFLTEDSADNYPDLTAGEYVKITVNDTGSGINLEIIDKIFDPYFTTREFGKGSGMGLSVVLGIVKNHGGAITVDSQPGEGATFTMLFPVVVDKPVAVVKTPDEIPLGTEAILFVDDEEFIVNMTVQMLERLGYKVETRTNPVEALELFQSEPDQFDLVITDMTMPQMTGARLSEKLKEVRSDVPIIICTGHSSLIDEEKTKKLGIAAYVMKPIVMSGIAKTIRKVLDAGLNVRRS